MASIHRQTGKPNWFCAYTDQTGTPRFKSTQTPNRKQAEKICGAIQKAVNDARYGELTADRARAIVESVVSDIARASGVTMSRQTVADFFNGWINAKGASESTLIRYRGIVREFLKHLGKKADGSLQSLTDTDIQTFRDKLAANSSTGNVNTYLKVIRTALSLAVKKNLLTRSPAIGVDKLDQHDKHQRLPFSIPALKKILEVASDEWRTMIFNGLYTGLRLSDCANLTAANLDLLKAEYTLTEKKTGKTRIIEIAKPLLRHLEELDLGDDPAAPLCPNLYGKTQGWLSNQFYDLLSSVGLVPVRNHQSKKKGRDVRRTQSALTFHSLRHTATSLLKNAGVSDSIARDIIGHESVAVSRQYTHIETGTRRAALDKMPDIVDTLKRQ